MNEDQIQETWTLFKEYLDKKHVEMAAERYVDMLADYGMSEVQLQDMMGNSKRLDTAIQYYLELDQDEDDDDEWDE